MYNSEKLEKKLDEVLTNCHYTSSMGWGERHFSAHHIEALKRDLMPFIEGEIEGAIQRDRKALSDLYFQRGQDD